MDSFGISFFNKTITQPCHENEDFWRTGERYTPREISMFGCRVVCDSHKMSVEALN